MHVSNSCYGLILDGNADPFATGGVYHCYATIIDLDVELRILVRMYRSNQYKNTVATVAIIISSK